MTMLDWAMAHDAELADRVLAGAAPALFGLSRWTELQRALDWIVADRPRGPNWAGAIAAASMGASMIGRRDLLPLTNEALRIAEATGQTIAVLHLRVGPSYARKGHGDLSGVRALVIDAIAAGENYPALAAATSLADSLAYLGQLDELAGACRATQLTASEGPRPPRHRGRTGASRRRAPGRRPRRSTREVPDAQVGVGADDADVGRDGHSPGRRPRPTGARRTGDGDDRR